MALSVGFRVSVALHPATQATRLLALASVGLPPTGTRQPSLDTQRRGRLSRTTRSRPGAGPRPDPKGTEEVPTQGIQPREPQLLPAERVRLAPPQLGAPPLDQVRAQSPCDPVLQPAPHPGSWRPLPVSSPASDRPVPHAPHPLRVHHAVQFCQGVIGQQRTDHATISAVRRSPVASLALLACRSPYAGGFAPAAPAAQRGWSPSPCVARLGLLIRLSAMVSRRGRIPILGRTANSSPRSSRG
jgi:hypothetical protein